MSELDIVRLVDSEDDLPSWDDDDALTYIQWKGTDVCMDWVCPSCGNQHHSDGWFCYTLKCHSCGVVLHVDTNVTLTPITERLAQEIGHTPCECNGGLGCGRD